MSEDKTLEDELIELLSADDVDEPGLIGPSVYKQAQKLIPLIQDRQTEAVKALNEENILAEALENLIWDIDQDLTNHTDDNDAPHLPAVWKAQRKRAEKALAHLQREGSDEQ